jgi:hypothetical protein
MLELYTTVRVRQQAQYVLFNDTDGLQWYERGRSLQPTVCLCTTDSQLSIRLHKAVVTAG